jgi:hypothetical protein
MTIYVSKTWILRYHSLSDDTSFITICNDAGEVPLGDQSARDLDLVRLSGECQVSRLIRLCMKYPRTSNRHVYSQILRLRFAVPTLRQSSGKKIGSWLPLPYHLLVHIVHIGMFSSGIRMRVHLYFILKNRL